MSDKSAANPDEQLGDNGAPARRPLQAGVKRPAGAQQGDAHNGPHPAMLALRDAVQRLETIRRRHAATPAGERAGRAKPRGHG